MKEDELLDLALTLYDGESRAGVLCPACKGGRSGERSLSINRDKHRAYYKCWRASCSCSGLVNLGANYVVARKEQLGGKRHVLETSPQNINESISNILRAKWYLTDDEIRRAELGTTKLHCMKAECRLYVPLFRFDRTIRGYVARDLEGEESKKALTFKFRTEEPNLGWHPNRKSSKLIIVEDAISSIRASTYMNACCLLGTHLDKNKVDDIVRNGFTEAYLALDKDATRKSVLTAIEWRNRLKLNVVRLDRDIKDLQPNELKEFMKELT